MQLHLRIAGGVTTDIGDCALKLIDVMETPDREEADRQMLGIASSLIRSLFESVLCRIEGIELEVSGSYKVLSKMLVDGKKISDLRQRKSHWLSCLSAALDALSNYTKEDYPKITNANGDEV
jgi:hypothetical protein